MPSARPALLFVPLLLLAAGCGSTPDTPDRICSAGDMKPCYSGPKGTKDVGICHAGSRSCRADGSGFDDACKGEITPQPETCATPEDDDCNGVANEAGAGCTCESGQTTACYSGPFDTTGIGNCKVSPLHAT